MSDGSHVRVEYIHGKQRFKTEAKTVIENTVQFKEKIAMKKVLKKPLGQLKYAQVEIKLRLISADDNSLLGEVIFDLAN